jgi:hypothetical protein
MEINSSLEIASVDDAPSSLQAEPRTQRPSCVSIGRMTDDDSVEMVKNYLRGQNLEQVGRVDEAIDLYESAVAARFDSTGPYDRLIALYGDRAQHPDVVRVAEAAIANVHTHADKTAWFERMRAEALRAQAKVPRAAPKRTSE